MVTGYLTVTTDSILVQVSADLIFQPSWGTDEHIVIVAHALGINVEIIITEIYSQALLSLHWLVVGR